MSTKRKPLVVVITGSKWARGGRITRLRNSDGTMCCLGFDAIKCGVDPKDIVLPSQFKRSRVKVNKQYAKVWQQSIGEALADEIGRTYYVCGFTSLEEAAVEFNDRGARSDDERIAKLRLIFKAAGRKLVWRPDL